MVRFPLDLLLKLPYYDYELQAMIKLLRRATIGAATVALLANGWQSGAKALTPNEASAIAIEQQVQAVVEHLVGIMDTSAQAAANPEAPNVRMTTCQVRVPDSEAVFLYQEQALAKSLDRPYRQRFLRIAPSGEGDSVESKAYKPLSAETWIGLCDRAAEQRTIQLSEMNDGECSVFLVPIDKVYVGNTQAGGCATNVRGAVRITNTIFLHAAGMDTWDRGFDANGKQVWGADGQAYQYRWVR